MAIIIDGKRISQEIKDELKDKVEALKAVGKKAALAVVQVGNDPASCVYVNKKKMEFENENNENIFVIYFDDLSYHKYFY